MAFVVVELFGGSWKNVDDDDDDDYGSLSVSSW